jgi:hypothetical protein
VSVAKKKIAGRMKYDLGLLESTAHTLENIWFLTEI